MTDTVLLHAEGIEKSFGGVRVLHGVNLTVHPGQVLALLGENGAGKSTLVKIIAGDYHADVGRIRIGDTMYDSLTPMVAKSLGIRMIFQELNDAGSLSVAENISLGEWPNMGGFVRWSELRLRAGEVLSLLGSDIDIDRTVGSLRVGERQLVEIARALRTNAKVLILDEPTAALSSAEVEQLFRAVRMLREQGVGMIYITHRLDEVLELADHVQVLRDGIVALTKPISEVTRTQMVEAMIGREAAEYVKPQPRTPVGDPTLKVDGLEVPSAVYGIDFEVRPGEVLTLYGKIGSGTAEVAEAIFGLHPKVRGSVEVGGEVFSPKNPKQAIAHGIGFLPPDRQRSGSFGVRSVAENLAAPSWPRLSKFGFVKREKENGIYRKWRERLRIRSTGDPGQPISTLSGGNQQKVLLARWLERGVKVLILVEPTRGVDVGARADIYESIRTMAVNNKIAVLVVTSDYEEVIQISDRAMVIVDGRAKAALRGEDLTAAALTEAAGG